MPYGRQDVDFPGAQAGRGESIAEKPSFRNAFKSRRCLVPADGFYEWRKSARGKVPYLIRRPDSTPFAFAGLWEHWKGPSGAIDSYTILTTDANELMRPIHDRMPVIVDPSAFDAWLDPAWRDVEVLKRWLLPAPAESMTAYAVGSRVSNARNEGEDLIEPV